MEFLEDIKIIREFLINIKQLKGTTNNFLALKNNFNDLLDFNLKQKFKIDMIKKKPISKKAKKGKEDL